MQGFKDNDLIDKADSAIPSVRIVFEYSKLSFIYCTDCLKCISNISANSVCAEMGREIFY